MRIYKFSRKIPRAEAQREGFFLEFKFGEYTTRVFISREIPLLEKITDSPSNALVICDENTSAIADKICGNENIARCILKSGEENKNWDAVLRILFCAFEAGLGRDALFIAVGGGVIGDIVGFASSIYMRGCRFTLVSTTLLGMVDASVGGKTGFDLFDIKNLAGSFYPAGEVYIPADCLATLPEKEWKSGFAELIKTAVLSGGDFLDELSLVKKDDSQLLKCIEKAVLYKGGIVSEDLRESGKRKLLNLGHTFAHALEAAAGLGKITHGEAVAWGMVRCCELGIALGITPKPRAEKIINLIKSFNYDCTCPHPLCGSADAFFNAMKSDKKKKQGQLTFIVPDEKSAQIVVLEENQYDLIKKIISGETV
jgi:3-dehydroquinate synthase